MSKIITYWSVNGGVGKTTLSSISAYNLAKRNPNKKVLLLDFNLINPDTDYHLNVSNVKDLKELFGYLSTGTLTEEILKDYMSQYPKMKNFSILSGLYDINFFDKIVTEHFITIIELARQLGFDYIIIDIDSSLNIDATFVALTSADRVFIICDSMYHSIRNTNRYLEDILSKIQVNDNNTDIIVNKYDPELISKDELKKILARNDLFFVDYNKNIPISVNKGMPFIEISNNRHTKNLLNQINELTDYIANLK